MSRRTKRRYTVAEIAEELEITTRTWYHWIKAGCVRAAPIVETMGAKKGGRVVFWEHEDLVRGRAVAAALAEGKRLREIARP